MFVLHVTFHGQTSSVCKNRYLEVKEQLEIWKLFYLVWRSRLVFPHMSPLLDFVVSLGP